MAVILSNIYTHAVPPSTDYPQGSFQNETAPFAADGTPLEKQWPNDIYGFLQRLLYQGGVVPSELPDTVPASDYLNAMSNIFAQWQTFTDSGVINAYLVTPASGVSVNSYYEGLIVRFRPVVTNDGASTLQVGSLAAKPIVYYDGNPLIEGEIVAGRYTTLIYNSVDDNFVLAGVIPGSGKLPPVDIVGLVPQFVSIVRVTISPGKALSTDGSAYLYLSVPITKYLDVEWVQGTDQGGRFAGVPLANETSYHLFAIYNPSTGVYDAGFDTSLIAANRPAGYSIYRRVGSVRSYFGSGGSFYKYHVTEMAGGTLRYTWDKHQPASTLSSLSSGVRTLLTTYIPGGIRAVGQFGAWIRLSVGGAGLGVLFSSWLQVDVPVELTGLAADVQYTLGAGLLNEYNAAAFDLEVGPDAEIYVRAEGANTDLNWYSAGYVDRRSYY